MDSYQLRSQYMNTMQYQLQIFHGDMKLRIGDINAPALADNELRANLIEEEAAETVKAIREGNFVETVDGLCDLLYVAFGAAVTFGIDLTPFFNEVHRTNMAKVGGPIRESDGKRLKPEGWKPPRLKVMLEMAEKGIYLPHQEPAITTAIEAFEKKANV